MFQSSSKQIVDSGLIAGSNIAGVLTGIISGVVIARIVTPELLGTFRSFGIITIYLNVLHFGLFDSLQRELPFILECQRLEEARRSLSASAAWLLLMLTVTSIGFIGLSAISLISGNYIAAAGWFVQPFILGATLYGGLLGTLFRTKHEFRNLARASLWGSLSNIVLLPCLVISPFYGLCLKTSLASMVNLTVLYIKKPLKIEIKWNSAELLRQLKVGAPLFGIGYIESSLWLATESYLVLRLFGTNALGLYVLTLAIREAANSIASAANQVYVPRIAASFSRTGSYKKTFALSSKATLTSCFINLLLATGVVLLLPPLMPLLMPRYMDAIPLIRLTAIFPILKALELPLYVFKAANERRWYACYVVVGYLGFIGMVLVLGKNHGIEWIIVSVIVGKATSIIIGSVGLLSRIKQEVGSQAG